VRRRKQSISSYSPRFLPPRGLHPGGAVHVGHGWMAVGESTRTRASSSMCGERSMSNQSGAWDSSTTGAYGLENSRPFTQSLMPHAPQATVYPLRTEFHRSNRRTLLAPHVGERKRHARWTLRRVTALTRVASKVRASSRVPAKVRRWGKRSRRISTYQLAQSLQRDAAEDLCCTPLGGDGRVEHLHQEQQPCLIFGWRSERLRRLRLLSPRT
jgi:hypothetical protein